MVRGVFHNTARDPRLARAVRESEQYHPARDDDELRMLIVRAAAPLLARLRERPRAWWEWTASWARVLVPVGLAASLAAGVLLVRYAGSVDATTVTPTTANSLVLDLAVGGTTAPEVTDELVAQPNDAWLLAQVMDQ